MTDTLERISILGPGPADGWQEQSAESWSFRLSKVLSENEDILARFEVAKQRLSADVQFSEFGRKDHISTCAAEFLASLGWEENEFSRAQEAIDELVSAREVEPSEKKDAAAAAIESREIRDWLMTMSDSARLDIFWASISSGDETTFRAILDAPPVLRQTLIADDFVADGEERWMSARSPQRAAELKGLRSLLARARSSHSGLVLELKSHLVDPPDEIARIAAGGVL